MIFNHDWWFEGPFQSRLDEAKRRCASIRYPKVAAAAEEKDPAFQKFRLEVEARTIVYLRDGFSYELKEIIRLPPSDSLSFECSPADEAYKVGAFIVTVPFDEIARVEVYAVHPKEKPEDNPSIKGFGGGQPPPKRSEERPRQEHAE